MSVIFVALPVALALAGAAVWGFAWSARQGQFEDLDTAKWRILIDDRDARSPNQGGQSEATDD